MQKLTKTTKYKYSDMLEVLPPEAYTHGRMRSGETFSCFLVGEASDHRQGTEVYQSYYTCDDAYYAGELLTQQELYDIANMPDALQEAMENASEPAEDSDDARIIEAINEHNEEIVEAYAGCFGWEYVTSDAISDSYYGTYDSDEEFAQQIAEDMGDIQEDVKWPYTAIDWELAARDLMYDFCEHDGYYFRNV